MGTFKASVQYGDWKGSVAADNADFESLEKYLDAKELRQPGEFLVATALWVGENHHGKLGTVYARAYLYPDRGGFDTTKDAIEASAGPLPVRIVDVKLSLGEYIALFKRFDVMLIKRGFDLSDREHTGLD